MPEQTDLSALPEAVPLRSVAPLWRVLAILALIVSAGLLLVVAVLGVALMSDSSRFVGIAGTPMPPPMYVAAEEFPDGPMPVPPDDPTFPGPDVGGPMPDPRLYPYPVRADLASADQSGPGSALVDSAARRFLRLGEDVWRAPRGQEPEHVAVSPDGLYLAAVSAGRLLAGTVTAGPSLEVSIEEGAGYGAPGSPDGGRPGTADISVPQAPPGLYDPGMLLTRPVVGAPAWQQGAPVVYFAVAGGRLRRCRFNDGPRGNTTELLSVAGDQPAPVPGAVEKLVLIRSRSVPKIDAPGSTPPADPTEVVLRDLATGMERILVPAGPSSWRHAVVSPNGTRLALVSDHGAEGRTGPRWRVFVVALTGGEPKPLTPPADMAGPVCWTLDGAGLVYARTHDAAAADHAEEEPAARFPGIDLFHLDLAGGRETRLSRGGGFFAPSMDDAGRLYYLTWRGPGQVPALVLRRVPLAAALSSVAKEKEGPARTPAAWEKLANRVLLESAVGLDPGGALVPAEPLGKVAEVFARAYEEAFGRKAPASLEELDRLRREVGRLALPRPARQQLQLVLGAAVGEFLRRQHGARWQLVKGPLTRVEATQAPASPESPFAAGFNPFELPSAERVVSVQGRTEPVRQASLRADVLGRAEGRILVLSNAPTAGADLVSDLEDADLARGEALLRQGKAEEGERVLREMLQREPHRENGALALHVGRLLYTHQRHEALADLMKRWSRKRPPDPRTYNLLGLAQLHTSPQQAADAFKSALRCDLHHGPAYLNLALAYERLNQRAAAAQCLRRYLQILPQGPLARDAQRRLGELREPAPAGAAAP